MIREFAHLEEHPWPYDCDGLASFGTSLPTIFINRQRPLRRKRFTKAHELGHVVLFWHKANVTCHVNPSNGQPAMEGYTQEREANEFASHLLVPDAFLAPFRNSYIDAPEILDALAVADVSAAAGVLALQRALLPGYIFQVPGLRLQISGGTALHCADIETYERYAVRHGVHNHQGQAVRWCQLAERHPVTIPQGKHQNATEALKKALLDYGCQDIRAATQSINGVVGGVLSKKSLQEPRDILGLLRHKFAFHDQHSELSRFPSFINYLNLRAIEVAEKRALEGTN